MRLFARLRYRETGAVIKLKQLNGDKWLVTLLMENFFVCQTPCERDARNDIVLIPKRFLMGRCRKRHKIKIHCNLHFRFLFRIVLCCDGGSYGGANIFIGHINFVSTPINSRFCLTEPSRKEVKMLTCTCLSTTKSRRHSKMFAPEQN